ncbi:unnamed protein product [Xylocopa violacea]|uniref:Uncharacterized protein n=1 Tax=Xylocopa violacea TaxID=135666 RepID=A0ABP1NX18_XYLVO
MIAPNGLLQSNIEIRHKNKTKTPKRLKRKKSTNSIDLEDNGVNEPKKHGKKESSNLTAKNPLNMYPEAHSGPPRVVIEMGEKLKEKRDVVEIKFKNKEQANLFAHNDSLKHKELEAFVPRYRFERKGMLKGYLTELDVTTSQQHLDDVKTSQLLLDHQ